MFRYIFALNKHKHKKAAKSQKAVADQPNQKVGIYRNNKNLPYLMANRIEIAAPVGVIRVIIYTHYVSPTLGSRNSPTTTQREPCGRLM